MDPKNTLVGRLQIERVCEEEFLLEGITLYYFFCESV
jgi:hypothetical protein